MEEIADHAFGLFLNPAIDLLIGVTGEITIEYLGFVAVFQQADIAVADGQLIVDPQGIGQRGPWGAQSQRPAVELVELLLSIAPGAFKEHGQGHFQRQRGEDEVAGAFRHQLAKDVHADGVVTAFKQRRNAGAGEVSFQFVAAQAVFNKTDGIFFAVFSIPSQRVGTAAVIGFFTAHKQGKSKILKVFGVPEILLSIDKTDLLALLPAGTVSAVNASPALQLRADEVLRAEFTDSSVSVESQPDRELPAILFS